MPPQSETSKEKSVYSVKLEEGVLSTPPQSRDELAAPDNESRYITGLKLYLINAGLIVSMFLVQMDSSMLVLVHDYSRTMKLTSPQNQHGGSQYQR
jgi:hypothetical protein